MEVEALCDPGQAPTAVTATVKVAPMRTASAHSLRCCRCDMHAAFCVSVCAFCNACGHGRLHVDGADVWQAQNLRILQELKHERKMRLEATSGPDRASESAPAMEVRSSSRRVIQRPTWTATGTSTPPGPPNGHTPLGGEAEWTIMEVTLQHLGAHEYFRYCFGSSFDETCNVDLTCDEAGDAVATGDTTDGYIALFVTEATKPSEYADGSPWVMSFKAVACHRDGSASEPFMVDPLYFGPAPNVELAITVPGMSKKDFTQKASGLVQEAIFNVTLPQSDKNRMAVIVMNPTVWQTVTEVVVRGHHRNVEPAVASSRNTQDQTQQHLRARVVALKMKAIVYAVDLAEMASFRDKLEAGGEDLPLETR